MVKKYIPERGDIVSFNFSPQIGHEQRGKRPALVLSPQSYNQKVGLLLAVPITSYTKDYPFEIALPKALKTKGVVLIDQLRSIDWQQREVEFIEKIDEENIHMFLKRSRLLLV